VLGPDKLLVIGLAVVADADRGRAKSRDTESDGLGRRGLSCAASMARLGYSAQEIAEVSDRLVDAIVGHGTWPSSAPFPAGLSLIDSTSSAAENEVRGS